MWLLAILPAIPGCCRLSPYRNSNIITWNGNKLPLMLFFWRSQGMLSQWLILSICTYVNGEEKYLSCVIPSHGQMVLALATSWNRGVNLTIKSSCWVQHEMICMLSRQFLYSALYSLPSCCPSERLLVISPFLAISGCIFLMQCCILQGYMCSKWRSCSSHWWSSIYAR